MKDRTVYLSLLAHVLTENRMEDKATEQASKQTPQPAPSEQPRKPEATNT